MTKWLDTYGAMELAVSYFERIDVHEDGPDSPIRYVDFVGDELALHVHRTRLEGQPVSWIVGGVRECADVTEWPLGEAPSGTQAP